MEKTIDFDLVADWYDTYVQADFDHKFWVEQVSGHPGAHLELMCGTGRISLPILRAGHNLTCVDYSAGLLNVFKQKLAREGLKAELIERDVRDLRLSGFDFAFIGFHSFSELLTAADQLAALGSILQALRPNGTLMLSLHNPSVRGPQLDGAWRPFGPFKLAGGKQLEMRGRYALDSVSQVATGLQHYREIGDDGKVLRELEMPLHFRLIGKAEVESLASQTGFIQRTCWGDYEQSPFKPDTSPFIIFEFVRSDG